MASKTEICNRALSKLGQPRVSNVETEDVKSARVMNTMFDNVRDAMLQSYPWNFTVTRAILAPDATAPQWGFNYAYTLPSDCLTILSIRYDPEYRVESGKILTDEGTALYISYIRRIEDTGLFTPLFNEAFATRLAFEGCEELTQSNTKKELLSRELSEIIDRAYRSDAIENQPDQLPEDEWLTARV